MTRETILAEVSAERRRQDALFGGVGHDDTHSATDWVGIIVRHLGLAMDDGKPADVCLMNDHCAGHDPVRYRRQLVRVAAIAVAALETFDRKTAGDDPMEFWRKVATKFGEPILLLDSKFSVVDQCASPCLAYAVTEADASEWERENHVARVEPSANGATP